MVEKFTFPKSELNNVQFQKKPNNEIYLGKNGKFKLIGCITKLQDGDGKFYVDTFDGENFLLKIINGEIHEFVGEEDKGIIEDFKIQGKKIIYKDGTKYEYRKEKKSTKNKLKTLKKELTNQNENLSEINEKNFKKINTLFKNLKSRSHSIAREILYSTINNEKKVFIEQIKSFEDLDEILYSSSIDLEIKINFLKYFFNNTKLKINQDKLKYIIEEYYDETLENIINLYILKKTN